MTDLLSHSSGRSCQNPLRSNNYTNRDTNRTTFYGWCRFCTWRETCFKSEVDIWWARKPTVPPLPLDLNSSWLSVRPAAPPSVLIAVLDCHLTCLHLPLSCHLGLWQAARRGTKTTALSVRDLGFKSWLPRCSVTLSRLLNAFPSLSLRAKWW